MTIFQFQASARRRKSLAPDDDILRILIHLTSEWGTSYRGTTVG